jgi:hypothetical protein
MTRPAPLTEANMQAAEARIPELAAKAGKAAHQRALRQTGVVIMQSVSGPLVEAHADGTERLIKPLPASTPVRRGMVLRRQKPARG